MVLAKKFVAGRIDAIAACASAVPWLSTGSREQ
jgi:hypothetical protein